MTFLQETQDYFSLRRLRRRNEKYFLSVLLASPEAGFEDFPAPALKKAKVQEGMREGFCGGGEAARRKTPILSTSPFVEHTTI